MGEGEKVEGEGGGGGGGITDFKQVGEHYAAAAVGIN
jgi:hypothetical protein